MPQEFGNWSTVFRRFRDWSLAGVFERLFAAVSDDPDMEQAIIDATIVPVHRRGHGAKGGTQNQAIGKYEGGRTTKTLALTDALGNLVRFVPLPANRTAHWALRL